MNAATALRAAREALAGAGIEQPNFEARLLVGHVLGLERGVLPDGDAQLDEARFAGLLAQRVAREPMALILGHQGFWTLELEVSAATLIPRADSEAVIEAALTAFPDRVSVRRIADFGTGTGCLLLAALSEFPIAWGVGVDIVPAAAKLARRNAIACKLADRAVLLCADWDAAISSQFDLILSNPPYIGSAEVPGLMPEVAGHEPRSALDGGADGLDAYRRLIPALPRLLTDCGVAILEIGQGQQDDVGTIARMAGLQVVAMQHDLGGIIRAIVLKVE